MNKLPKMYTKLASWWPLISAPPDYEEEATIFRNIFTQNSKDIETLLELGCGGGNNASHLKKYFKMTLTDISPDMLEVSKKLNPECEHIKGDMRNIRLNRVFDGILIHDAIMYMTTKTDLKKAIETAYIHCKDGGCVLVVPDVFKETLIPKTEHGGHDGKKRRMRYLEWTYDPDPDDSTFTTDFVYLLREKDGTVQIEYDRHIHGIFSKEKWLKIMAEVGFEVKIIPVEHSEIESGLYNAVLGVKKKKT
jgi:ubiquinone/menaquinone biosynthesis C-methylase UbiE